MSGDFALPERGFAFWPVGCGDSSTIVVDDNVVLQLDLRHMEKSEDDDDPAWPVIDELVRLLPRKSGKPYLAVFALTHPDQHHIAGFEELLRRVVIGEIWHTPRIFRDYEKHAPLCEAARAFRSEAHRRRRKMTGDWRQRRARRPVARRGIRRPLRGRGIQRLPAGVPDNPRVRPNRARPQRRFGSL